MKINSFQNLTLALGTMLVLAAAAAPGASQAATIASKWKSNAAGVCQSAFSSGAGAVIRARPLAVQNEGAANAFVTCSLPYNDEGNELPTGGNFNDIGVRLVNTTASNVEVTCTLVSGTDTASTVFVPKAGIISANAVGLILFSTTDLPGDPAMIEAPNFSCGLPPGLGVNYVYYYYNRQIGT